MMRLVSLIAAAGRSVAYHERWYKDLEQCMLLLSWLYDGDICQVSFVAYVWPKRIMTNGLYGACLTEYTR